MVDKLSPLPSCQIWMGDQFHARIRNRLRGKTYRPWLLGEKKSVKSSNNILQFITWPWTWVLSSKEIVYNLRRGLEDKQPTQCRCYTQIPYLWPESSYGVKNWHNIDIILLLLYENIYIYNIKRPSQPAWLV